MPPITDYAFGKMTINGKSFTRDLIIFPDGRVRADWFRQSGHLLRQSDLDAVLQETPGLIVAGTGAYGRMEIAPGLEGSLGKMGIRLVTMETAEAVKFYNSRFNKNSPGLYGCFHLTC